MKESPLSKFFIAPESVQRPVVEQAIKEASAEQNNIYDFDLPEVEEKKSGKPRIHVSDQSCTSCEG